MFFDHTVLDTLARAGVLSLLGLFWIIFVVRVVGLRAFSKMTAFDFVVTVATGSLLAGAAQATDWPAFAQAALAVAALLLMQFAVARLRSSSGAALAFLQNTPVMLMENGVIDDAALSRTRVTRSDLTAKLREANVLDFDSVRAVVLETTGDISVLHGDRLGPALVDGVRRISG